MEKLKDSINEYANKIELFELFNVQLPRTDLKFFRSLYEKIDWTNRLIGIKGARGTGKTTMRGQLLWLFGFLY